MGTSNRAEPHMHVSVAICTWNRAALVRQTLEEFRRLRVPAHVSWELIVVDNNSTDSTAQVIADFADVLPIRYQFEGEPGHSAARNAAIRAASGELLLFTDDDVLVAPEWLEACVAAYQQFPDAAAFGGPIHPWFPIEPDPILAAAFPMLARGFCGIDYQHPLGPVDESVALIGANMAFRLAAVGDQRFDLRHGVKQADHRGGGDEIDFVERLRERGHCIVWVPDMTLRHYVEPSRMSLAYLKRNTEGHGAFLIRKNGVGTAPLLFGAPRWAWKRAATEYARYIMLRAARQKRDAYVALREYCLAAGMIKEARAATRPHVKSPRA
jgi:glucosyl-dolichyl phosphate glucuronosyltransferase